MKSMVLLGCVQNDSEKISRDSENKKNAIIVYDDNKMITRNYEQFID